MLRCFIIFCKNLIEYIVGEKKIQQEIQQKGKNENKEIAEDTKNLETH